ncbi:hypothetical protein QR680_018636 [Steinernema hermaphroditum]|uniref:C-type lectin domain-containing protein n=1 Tax=Steinernema hermaphroditum TaxID=289476 RepID=A0AA39HJI9_9BILA|nr:hypothetical protein QR680_018636 [Steinernema hermaphroditum]
MLVLLLSLLAFVPPALGTFCQQGSVTSADGKKCYMIEIAKKTFQDSRSHCQQLYYGDLVSIHSKAENDFLKSYTEGQFWIGAKYNGTGQTWQWQWLDGSAFTYNNWAAGEGVPLDHVYGKDYALVDSSTGLWVAAKPTEKQSFICEIPRRDFNQPTVPSEPNCPSGSLCHGGYAYISPNVQFYTWKSAENYCKDKFNGHLASVHNDATEKILEQVIPATASGVAFLGGYVDTDNKLAWSDGTPVDYTHYYPGHTPTTYKQGQCLYMFANGDVTQFGWELFHCGDDGYDDYNAVCQYKH